jgi:Tetratricopeptide repeat
MFPGARGSGAKAANAAHCLGRLEEARTHYRRFLAIQPNDAALIRKRVAEVEQAIEQTKKTAARS